MSKRKVWIAVIALVLVLVAVLLILQGSKKNVMFVCDAFVSDETLLDAFDTYQRKYQPFEAHPKPTYVSFDVDFEAKSCSVTRLSIVDESDMEEELHSYIDYRAGTLVDGQTIKVDTSWWYDSSEWEQQHTLWSYLMIIEDMDGQDHYYYCRVNYSKS